MRHRFSTLLVATLLFFTNSALAQTTPNLSNVRVVVPDALGLESSGTAAITAAVRRVLGESVTLVDATAFEQELKKLGTSTARARPKQIAQAGRNVGAAYVLRIAVTKKGWLYTARALIVNCQTAELQMDFRSQYYKPKEETDDRGRRIGAKAAQKLGILITSAPPPPPPPPVVVQTTTTTETSTAVATTTTDQQVTDEAMDETFDEGGDEDFDAAFEAAFAGDAEVDAELDGSTIGSWNWTVSGNLRTDYYAFPSKAASGLERHLVKAGVRNAVTGTYGENVRIRVLPFVEWDLREQRLHRVLLEEGFLELALGDFELRAGWDALTWGAASGLNIVDVINARDFTEGIIDAPKIGQPMFAVRYLIGNHSVSVLYLTPFIQPNLPREGTVFSPIQRPPGSPPITTLLAGSEDEWNPQAAARVALAFSGFDLRLSYFYGYERFPLIDPTTGTLVFPLIHHLSTDGQLIAGGITMTWEVASIWHISTDRTKNPPFMLPTGMAAPEIAMPGLRVNWVLGVEKTFESVLGNTRITPLVEFIGSSDSEWFRDTPPVDDATQFFQNHLAFGFEWAFQNGIGSELRVVNLMDLANPADHFVEAEYSERWFGSFTFLLAARWGFAAEDTNKMASLKQLSGVRTGLRLNF